MLSRCLPAGSPPLAATLERFPTWSEIRRDQSSEGPAHTQQLAVTRRITAWEHLSDFSEEALRSRFRGDCSSKCLLKGDREGGQARQDKRGGTRTSTAPHRQGLEDVSPYGFSSAPKRGTNLNFPPAGGSAAALHASDGRWTCCCRAPTPPEPFSLRH